jgi:hypothetical protein
MGMPSDVGVSRGELGKHLMIALQLEDLVVLDALPMGGALRSNSTSRVAQKLAFGRRSCVQNATPRKNKQEIPVCYLSR